jgi:predicted MPP superfamily phosphohydrolase
LLPASRPIVRRHFPARVGPSPVPSRVGADLGATIGSTAGNLESESPLTQAVHAKSSRTKHVRNLAARIALRQIQERVLTRRRRSVFVALVTLLAMALQVPAVFALGHLVAHRALAFALAVAVNAPFLLAMRNPWRDWARARLWLYLGLWPFFAWSATCLAFLLVLPAILLVAFLTPLGFDRALAAGGVASVVIGLRALSGRPRLVAHDVAVADLPRALDGYRIAHISDLHCGPMTQPRRVERWVAAVNELSADLIAVTGDLITSGDAYVAAIASALGRLRAPDGVFVSLGNHDYFTDAPALVSALEREDLTVLCNRGTTIARKDAALYVAGADDTWTKRADVERAMAARPGGAPAVLLAHDPELFPEAVAAGADLVLSGHTHGGQFAFPGFSRRWNLARVVTRFTTGLYRAGKATLYVSRGLGTTGPPIRLGARPEIAVLTLRAG